MPIAGDRDGQRRTAYVLRAKERREPMDGSECCNGITTIASSLKLVPVSTLDPVMAQCSVRLVVCIKGLWPILPARAHQLSPAAARAACGDPVIPARVEQWSARADLSFAPAEHWFGHAEQ
eukprot:COSAG02_NODE_9635_length_2153_cov_804.529211_2_plen_121_part_00